MKKKALIALLSLLVFTGCGNSGETAKTSGTSDDCIVTFNPNDRDQEISQVEVKSGEKMEEPEDPAREDYVFTGWYLDKRATKKAFDFDTEITDDLFLYAGWTSTTVDVTFDPGYADGKTQTVRVNGGEVIEESKIPEAEQRENYEFLGWYEDGTGETPFDFSKTLTKNTTVYGCWKQLKATVTFDPGYFGAEEIEPQVLDLTKKEKVKEPETPVRGETGDYDFDGWFVGKEEEPYDFDSEVTGDITLTARWTMEKATVTYDFNTEDGEKQVEKVKVGEQAKEFDKIQRTGYGLTGWYFDKDCTAPADFTGLEITDDMTVYGAWEAQPCTITYKYNYEGAPEDTVVESVYDAITEEPEDPERDGQEFIGWFLDPELEEPFAFGEGLTGDITLYAGWMDEEEDEEDVESDSETASDVKAETDGGTTVVTEEKTDAEEAANEEESENAETGTEAESTADSDKVEDSNVADTKASDNSDKKSGKKSRTNILTFYVNDGTDAVYQTEEVPRNKYSDMKKEVTYPKREGYTVVGWYTTADCEEGTEFNFNSRVTESADLYVKWTQEYVFEAELTQLTDIPIGDTGKTEDKLGFGESSNPKGLYLIEWDSYGAGASNEYYVSYLYNPGSYLEFCITAKEDVENASLTLRLTPELHDMYFKTGGPDGTAAEKNGYKVYVNPVYSFNSVTNKETLESFDQEYDLNYDLTGAVTKDEDPNYTTKRPFEDYLITDKLSLHAGDNIIRLVTDNNHDYGGSMHAAAPMVDCIKICTEAEIGWTEGCEHTENLDGIDVRWPEKKNKGE